MEWNREIQLSYTDISKSYMIAIEWLTKNSFIKKNSRLSVYKDVLNDFANNSLNLSEIKNKYSGESILGALYDGIEVIDIFNSLNYLNNEIPNSYLKNLDSGSLCYLD
ncbi:MAG: hypothetical protein JNM51_02730, partial [Bacteroidia bacterium]|nr:hypothetical protein [Bacteroidia bacterium]